MQPCCTTGMGNLIKMEGGKKKSAIILNTWADQNCVLYMALFISVIWSRGQRSMCAPPCQKLTLPGASNSSGISQQEPKTHSCYPASPLRSVEGVQQGWEWLRVALIHEWQRGQNEGGNQTGQWGLITLNAQMCIPIIFAAWAYQQKRASCGKSFALLPHLCDNTQVLAAAMCNHYV